MNYSAFLFLILISPLSWGQVVSNSGGGSFTQKGDCLLITNGFLWKDGIIAMTRIPQEASKDGDICSIDDLQNHSFFLFNKDEMNSIIEEQRYLFDRMDSSFLNTMKMTTHGYSSSSDSYFFHIDVDFSENISNIFTDNYPEWIILFPIDNDEDVYRWNRFIEDFEERSRWRKMTLYYSPLK